MHWTNAVAMIVMIASGWQIYNDEVLFGWLHFPSWITIGGGAEGALQWHFLAMWILVLNGFAYLAYGLETGRFRRMLLPIRPHEVLLEIRKALRLELEHDDLTRYNAVQRLLYIGIIVVIIVQVLSGLVIWKPVQFSELAFLFYDFQGARLVHFLGMVAIVGFVLVHVALALIVPKTLVAMLTGGPQVPERPARSQPLEADAVRTSQIRIGCGRAMSLRTPSPSIFRPKRGIDQSVLEENKRAGRYHRPAQGSARRREPRRPHHAHGLRRDAVATPSRACCERCRSGTTAPKRCCSGPTTWPRRISPRRSSSRRASTPTTMSRTWRRSTPPTGSWS